MKNNIDWITTSCWILLIVCLVWLLSSKPTQQVTNHPTFNTPYDVVSIQLTDSIYDMCMDKRVNILRTGNINIYQPCSLDTNRLHINYHK